MTLPPDLRSTRFPENGRSLQKTGSSGVFVGRYPIPRISPFRQALFESLRAASVCSAKAFSENLSIVLINWSSLPLKFCRYAHLTKLPQENQLLELPTESHDEPRSFAPVSRFLWHRNLETGAAISSFQSNSTGKTPIEALSCYKNAVISLGRVDKIKNQPI